MYNSKVILKTTSSKLRLIHFILLTNVLTNIFFSGTLKLQDSGYSNKEKYLEHKRVNYLLI